MVGARVRVLDRAIGRDPVVGRVVALSGDTLTLLPETDRFHPSLVLLERASRIDVSIAHHNLAGRGAFFSAAVGGLLGAFVVGMRQGVNDLGENLAGGFGASVPHHTVSNAPIFIGAMAGCAAGALVGASKTVDTWVPVSVRASWEGSSEPDPRLRLAVGVRF